MARAITTYVERHAELIDRALRARLPVSSLEGTSELNAAIRYAVVSGGKRMRPVMVLLSAELCGGTPELAIPAACAVEFLHTSSLVLDDLPGMDDGTVRRGFATVHRMFGEDMALLAALALLNQAYAIFAEYPALLAAVFREVGVQGMIGGQAADIRGIHGASRLEKTTALTRLTMLAGAAAAGGGREQCAVLTAFGAALGEAYQICDDIVDALGDDVESGKTVRQDQRHARWGTATHLGYQTAGERVRELISNSVALLRGLFGDSKHVLLLEEFAWSVVKRGLDLVRDDSAAVVRPISSGCVECDALAGGSAA